MTERASPPPLDPAVLALDGEGRYRYSVEQIRTAAVLWIVESDELTLTWESEDGEQLLPVWPTALYAAGCLTGDERAEGFAPVMRTLEDWLARSTPALVREHCKVGVFPNAQRMCPVVDPGQFAQDLSPGEALFLQGKDLSALRRRVTNEKKRR